MCARGRLQPLREAAEEQGQNPGVSSLLGCVSPESNRRVMSGLWGGSGQWTFLPDPVEQTITAFGKHIAGVLSDTDAIYRDALDTGRVSAMGHSQLRGS